MIYETADQPSLFDLDIWSGRMCQEHLVQTEGKTSKPSSQRSSKSSNRNAPMFLCLCGGGGPSSDQSRMSWEGGVWLGGRMTHNIGEFRNEEDGFVSLLTSTERQQQIFCLTLNCGEKPRAPNQTKLSEILEENPDEKYKLSPRACLGILNRAERRGKELPSELREALERQCDRH